MIHSPYAMGRPSVVCMSVCRLSVTLLHPMQRVGRTFWQCFCTV